MRQRFPMVTSRSFDGPPHAAPRRVTPRDADEQPIDSAEIVELREQVGAHDEKPAVDSPATVQKVIADMNTRELLARELNPRRRK